MKKSTKRKIYRALKKAAAIENKFYDLVKRIFSKIVTVVIMLIVALAFCAMCGYVSIDGEIQWLVVIPSMVVLAIVAIVTNLYEYADDDDYCETIDWE